MHYSQGGISNYFIARTPFNIIRYTRLLYGLKVVHNLKWPSGPNDYYKSAIKYKLIIFRLNRNIIYIYIIIFA